MLSNRGQCIEDESALTQRLRPARDRVAEINTIIEKLEADPSVSNEALAMVKERLRARIPPRVDPRYAAIMRGEDDPSYNSPEAYRRRCQG